jgi:hypothetical protein
MDGNATPQRSLALCAAAALLVGTLGGVVWAVVVKATDYEVGIVAWGIGFLTAFVSVRVVSRGGRDVQALAIVTALAGIFVGKYLGFALVLSAAAKSELGVEIGIVSGDMISFFRHGLGDVFGYFDLLWVALAVASAFRVAQGRGSSDGPAVAKEAEPDSTLTLTPSR